MDLALNNRQRFICHKTQTNKQPTKVNVIARLEFYLANYSVKVQYLSHNATIFVQPYMRSFWLLIRIYVIFFIF